MATHSPDIIVYPVFKQTGRYGVISLQSLVAQYFIELVVLHSNAVYQLYRLPVHKPAADDLWATSYFAATTCYLAIVLVCHSFEHLWVRP